MRSWYRFLFYLRKSSYIVEIPINTGVLMYEGITYMIGSSIWSTEGLKIQEPNSYWLGKQEEGKLQEINPLLGGQFQKKVQLWMRSSTVVEVN